MDCTGGGASGTGEAGGDGSPLDRSGGKGRSLRRRVLTSFSLSFSRSLLEERPLGVAFLGLQSPSSIGGNGRGGSVDVLRGVFLGAGLLG